jgi:hypothetical protein
MKTINTSISMLLMLSTALYAQEPAITSKAVVFDASDIQQSSVNVIAPAGGVVTVGIDGKDVFISGAENMSGVELEINRKTALVKLGSSKEDYVVSVGLGTVCGISVSVNIKALGTKNSVDNFGAMNPKVLVKAAKDCNF